MSVLPAPLKPWAPQLALLQRELALALAPWIQRLSLSIGPLADAASQPAGAPDGYDGVARKGSYERLLVSEWLYAQEAPEEFIRRAAEGEHLFSRLAVREPHQARRCVALFDPGPSQLGAPRIAHLAAFIALAARCDAAHAQLEWGVLQAPGVLRSGFDKAAAEALLNARTAREPKPGELEAWAHELDLSVDDVWLIGGGDVALGPLADRAQRLEVRDVLEPGLRRLQVSVRRPARPPKTVHLELPPPAVCTALLRAPFALERAPRVGPTVTRPTRGLVFAAAAQRLYTLGRSGELLSVTLPRTPGATARQVAWQPPADQRVIAAGWHKGLLCLTALVDAGGRVYRLLVHAISKRGEPRGPPERFEVPASAALPLPEGTFSDLAALSFAGKRRLVVTLLGRAFTLANGRLIEGRDRVLAHTQRGHRVHFLIVDDQGRRQVRTLHANGTETHAQVEGLGAARAYFAGGRHAPLPALALGALASSPRWALYDHLRPPIGLDVPPGGTVMGVTPHEAMPAGLVVRSADLKQLLHVSAAGVEVLVETESELLEVAAGHEAPRVAWLDASGALGVFDASRPQSLLIGLPDGNGRRLVHFTEYLR